MPADGRADVIAAVSAALERLGFSRVHVSRTGSHYPRRPGTPFRIRIANHAAPLRGSATLDVLHDRIITAADRAADADAIALACAVAFTAALRARTGLVKAQAVS